MVRVDATDAAEIVLGHVGVELVQAQMSLAAHDLQPVPCHAGGDGAAAPAHRTIAAARVDDALGQVQQQLDRAAMTTGPVLRLHGYAGHGGDAHLCSLCALGGCQYAPGHASLNRL
ncbi:hypothetical protein D3C72_1490020 [compost metagenome]